ncbi:uncharacterized protein [Palaemon carinicauda]|uniref:uncharacterized protein n=1 Tax=Palaemon carinicauda TaxID=392227 RepID=UPI0035B58B89
MSSSSFASGEELFLAKNRNQLLPSWGAKESEVSGSWVEEKQVAARLQDRHELISEIRLARKDQLATGTWIDNSKMVLLTHQTGTFWEYMGVETDIGRCLYPEEALYLIEMGELEVMHGEMPLSMQAAQSVMLLDEYHLDLYLVYSHLARSGCKIVRHQPHIRFTKYEKQIRLDQHQVKKNKKKLKLKAESSMETSQEKVKDVQLLPQKSEKDDEVVELVGPNLDAALKDFYSVLGDEVSFISETNKNDDVREVSKADCSSDKVSKVCEVVDLSEDMDDYERKRREYLDMFPCMLGMTSQIIYAEESDLFPENSKPVKEVYKISLEILNYYSRYLDDGNHNNQWKWENTNNWNRGRGNNSRRPRYNTGGFQGRPYNNGNRGKGRESNSHWESRLGSRGAGMHMDNHQVDREKNNANISNVETFLYNVRNEGIKTDHNGSSRSRNAGDTLQGSRNLERGSSHYSNIAESVPSRDMPRENRWAENGKYGRQNNKRVSDGNLDDMRVDWQNDFRENIQNESNRDRNIYGSRERESFDTMRQALRRENNSRWQDELEKERKMARLDNEDIKGRQEMSQGERWNRDSGDIRGRQEISPGERWSRPNERNIDEWERQGRLLENARDMTEQRFDGRWDRQEKIHEDRIDDTRDRWGRLPEERWGEIRHATEYERRGYNEPGGDWHDNELQHRRGNINESCISWRDDARKPECVQGKLQNERQRDNHAEHHDHMTQERWADNKNHYGEKSMWVSDRGNNSNSNIYNSHQSDRRDTWGRPDNVHGRENNYQSREDRTYVGNTRNARPDWHQHDDRWSDQESQSDSACFSGKDRSDYSQERFGNRGQDPSENWHSSLVSRNSPSHSDIRNEPEIDLTVTPTWKTKRRKRNRKGGYDTYPSYLVKLPMKVNSWKEYKDLVNSMSEDKMLNQGFGQALWRGPSVPLIKPTMASTLENVLHNCCIKMEENHTDEGYPMDCYLVLHYDVYLPSVVYRKTSPSIPSKRITVIRNGVVPSLKQIEEVTKRFPDEAPVVCAVVTAEVRLYTLSPITIPSPAPS